MWSTLQDLVAAEPRESYLQTSLASGSRHKVGIQPIHGRLISDLTASSNCSTKVDGENKIS